MKKKWATKVNGKVVKHGQVGARIGKAGSKKQASYCARSLGIAKKFPSARLKTSPNYQSRRKWKCKISEVEK
jgi:hypothetical protein